MVVVVPSFAVTYVADKEVVPTGLTCFVASVTPDMRHRVSLTR